ncbi:MAG: TonB family protein [Deltaproteobacteria bacterium]|nr:TonB family protein [Deltaproteobacteria bacterium]
MANPPNILRIGVIQGVSVIEERMIGDRVPVSFGTAPNNTFVLQGSDLPRSVTLFETVGEGYQLVFGEDAQGQVEPEPGKPVKLSDIKAKASKQGDRFRWPLPESARGRVRISNEIQVLFHFVPPAPTVAAGALPTELRGGFIGNLEPVFTAVLLASFLMHAAMALFVRLAEPPKARDDLEDLRKFVETIQPPKVEVPKIAVNIDLPVSTGPGPGEKVVEKGDGGGGGGGGGKGKGGGGGKGVGDRAALRDQIAGRGILQLIGGRGGAGGGGGAVGSVFGAGSSISDDIGSALQGTAGVGIAGAGGAGGVTRRGTGGGGVAGDGTGGGLGGGAAGIGDLGTGGGGKVDTGSKQTARIVARVRADDVEAVDGKVDKKGVAATIRRRQDAFQACYETALRANSKLQGKLVIEFTIGEGGKVTDARIVRDGLGSSEVANCVLATMRRIRFPAPSDGEVTISNSFVFQPSGG